MPTGIYTRTEKIKESLSRAHMGKPRGGNPKNWKHTKETKETISRNRKGKLMGNINGFYKGQIPWNKGFIGFLGKEKHYNWQGGITLLANQIRRCFQCRQWISDVFTRDDFICQECGIRGGKLDAHHIKRFSEILRENHIKTLEEALNCEELWNINNGITLCKECHKKYSVKLN